MAFLRYPGGSTATRSGVAAGVWCVVASLALLFASAPADAARKKPITGKLSKPGYTVIALAADGKATSKRTKPRKFNLRPPAKRVTLHLRARDGTYAGPIVIAKKKKGKRAILGVKAGAKLGKVKITASKGYAKLKRNLPKKLIDAKRKARAKKGVPIGAGKFGRVRSKKFGRGAPGDRDLDGIPDPLDIDDDGDLVLDNFDSSTAARAAQIEEHFDLHSSIGGDLFRTANANAAGLTDQQIEATFSTSGALGMNILSGDSAELDCGGLTYCSSGGTGRIYTPGADSSNFPPFPGCCDTDGDGFGTLSPSPIPSQPFFVLSHGTTTAKIGTGNVLIERIMRSGAEIQFPAAVQSVFATVPALVSYSDGQGNSATVSYPVAGPDPGPPGLGTRENGFPVTAGPNGDVVVTLTFWRPQRRPIPPENGAWIDIGRLNYAAAPEGGVVCPQSTFSETDPNLTPSVSPIAIAGQEAGGLTDLSADQPTSAANTFTYTLNLTQCLGAGSVSWSPGETRTFYFAGVASSGAPDNTGQTIAFKRT